MEWMKYHSSSYINFSSCNMSMSGLPDMFTLQVDHKCLYACYKYYVMLSHRNPQGSSYVVVVTFIVGAIYFNCGFQL